MWPEDWEHYRIEIGIAANSAKIHAATFTDEKVAMESLLMLDQSILKELWVK